MDLTFKIAVSVPQLVGLGDQIMAGLTSIVEALGDLESTLDTELTQIADALAGSPSQDEVDAVAQRVVALRDRIANIIPDMPA